MAPLFDRELWGKGTLHFEETRLHFEETNTAL
jgi:hypothetical protein